MELLELFDENENPLDKKIVRGYEIDDNEYIMIVYLFIINSDNQILLEKNAVTCKWVIPGGHVNTKKVLKNVEREIKEELGIDIDVKKLKSITTIKKNHRLFKLFFLKKDISVDEFKFQKEEVSSAKFFDMEEIDHLIDVGSFRENNIILLDSLKKYLQK